MGGGVSLRGRFAAWLMWRALERTGPPPDNVRVVGPGSIQQPVSCSYDGYYAGAHHWRVIVPPGPVYGLLFDTLPDCSAVVVARSDPTRGSPTRARPPRW